MSKKNINFNLTQLIQSHIEDANNIKKENIKKDEAFQAHKQELQKKIRYNDDDFNDI